MNSLLIQHYYILFPSTDTKKVFVLNVSTTGSLSHQFHSYEKNHSAQSKGLQTNENVNLYKKTHINELCDT